MPAGWPGTVSGPLSGGNGAPTWASSCWSVWSGPGNGLADGGQEDRFFLFRFWSVPDPSSLTGVTGVLHPQVRWTPCDRTNLDKISRLPHVKRVETQSGLNILPLAPRRCPSAGRPPVFSRPGNGYAGVDGLFFNQDKVAVLKGRMANP